MNLRNMKKLFGFLFAAVAVLLLSVSCRHKVVRDECRALVDEINDSVLVGKIDGNKVKFDISEAAFTHGAVMYGDSVIIHYIGDLSMKRAFAESVFLLERKSQIIEIPRDPAKRDTTAELKVRPIDKQEMTVKKSKGDRMARAIKEYAK